MCRMTGAMKLGRLSGRHAGSGHPLVLETRGTEHDAVVTHIDRLPRGLTYGLRVIEGLHRAGVEFPPLSEDFDSCHGQQPAPALDGACLQRVVAEFDQGAHGRGPGECAVRGAFPWPATQPDRAATGVHPGGMVEGSEPAGTGQAPGGQPLGHPTSGPVEAA